MDRTKKSPLAEKLIELRKAKGMTQSRIAEELNINRSTYAYYERSTTPPVEVLRKLAKLLDTTVDDMLGNKPTRYVYNPDTRSDIITFNQPKSTYGSEPLVDGLSADDRIFLARYQSLSPEAKIKFQEYLRKCEDEDSEE